MGRITVFSTSTCPHCKRAKALLADKGWEYSEVSLSDYPEQRTAMLQLADKLSVPQIFFNERHLGGASELAGLDERGELQALYEEMAAAPAPTDARLAKPDYDPPPPPEPPVREPEPAIELGEGASATYPEVVATLARELPIEHRTHRATSYHNSFVGSEAVDVLMRVYTLPSREAALALGKRLQQAGLFDHVVPGDHAFKDEFLFYRLQEHASPTKLNSSRVWKAAAEAAVPCIVRLKKQLSKIIDACTDKEGKVDYIAAGETAEYAAFRLDSCELQAVDFLALAPDARLAFCINLCVAPGPTNCCFAPPCLSSQPAIFHARAGDDDGSRAVTGTT